MGAPNEFELFLQGWIARLMARVRRKAEGKADSADLSVSKEDLAEYDKVVAFLYPAAMSCLFEKDPEIAEEAIADTLYAVMCGRVPNIFVTAEPGKLLLAVARILAIRHAMKKYRNTAAGDVAELDAVAERHWTVDELPGDLEVLSRCLSRLNADQKKVIRGHYTERKNINDLAVELEKVPDHIYYLRKTALRVLKECMNRHARSAENE